MEVQCPSCKTVHQVSDQLAGTQARCRCGAVVSIPAATTPFGAESGASWSGTDGGLPAESDLFAGNATSSFGAGGTDPDWPMASAGSSTPWPGVAHPSPGSLGTYGSSASVGQPSGNTAGRDADILRKYMRDDASDAVAGERPEEIQKYGTLKIVALFFIAVLAITTILMWTNVMKAPGGSPRSSTAHTFSLLWCFFLFAVDGAAIWVMFRPPPRYGWHIAAFSYLFWAISFIPLFIVHLFVAINLPFLLGQLFYPAYAVKVLQHFFTRNVIQYFQLKQNPWVALGIVFAISVVIWCFWSLVMIMTFPPWPKR